MRLRAWSLRAAPRPGSAPPARDRSRRRDPCRRAARNAATSAGRSHTAQRCSSWPATKRCQLLGALHLPVRDQRLQPPGERDAAAGEEAVGVLQRCQQGFGSRCHSGPLYVRARHAPVPQQMREPLEIALHRPLHRDAQPLRRRTPPSSACCRRSSPAPAPLRRRAAAGPATASPACARRRHDPSPAAARRRWHRCWCRGSAMAHSVPRSVSARSRWRCVSASRQREVLDPAVMLEVMQRIGDVRLGGQAEDGFELQHGSARRTASRRAWFVQLRSVQRHRARLSAMNASPALRYRAERRDAIRRASPRRRRTSAPRAW